MPKMKNLESKKAEALEKADLRLTDDMRSILRSIAANCKYTRNSKQVKEYRDTVKATGGE